MARAARVREEIGHGTGQACLVAHGKAGQFLLIALDPQGRPTAGPEISGDSIAS